MRFPPLRKNIGYFPRKALAMYITTEPTIVTIIDRVRDEVFAYQGAIPGTLTGDPYEAHKEYLFDKDEDALVWAEERASSLAEKLGATMLPPVESDVWECVTADEGDNLTYYTTILYYPGGVIPRLM